MKTTVDKLENSRVKITSELEYDELKPAVNKAAKTLSQRVNIPGFRRGKVPTRILENHIGRAAIIEQAVNDSLDGYYQDALVDNELTPLGPPSVDITEWPNLEGPEGGKLVYTIEVDVKPEIELPDFADITLEVDRPEVTDEDVEERLTEIRERFATLKSVDRAIEDMDFVNIDMTATIDGEEIDSVSGISYQLGSGQLLEGIDDALTGKKEGDEVEFVSKLAGGDHEGELADVTVTVHSVKVQELPEADDDFAQLASEFDTIDEFKEDLRGEVEKDKLNEVVFRARDLLLEKLNEQIDVPVPPAVIEDEIKRHLQNEGKAEDDPHGEEIREETIKGFKNQMILDAIASTREVNLEQNELFEFMVAQAQMYGMEPNQFIQAAAQTNQIPAFAGELTRNKAVVESLRDVKIVDKDGNAVDLSPAFDDDEAEGAEDEAASAEAETTDTKDKSTEEAAEGADEADADESKPAAKKPAAKKSATKKPAATKATSKKSDTAEAKESEDKPATKKAPAKKSAAKTADAESEDKPAAKKPAAKKAPAKKPAAKKPAAKKSDGE